MSRGRGRRQVLGRCECDDSQGGGLRDDRRDAGLCAEVGEVAGEQVLHDVEDVSLHTLRHEAASLMITGGAEIVAVSKTLGHARASSTLNIYAHSASEPQMAALGSLGRALGL